MVGRVERESEVEAGSVASEAFGSEKDTRFWRPVRLAGMTGRIGPRPGPGDLPHFHLYLLKAHVAGEDSESVQNGELLVILLLQIRQVNDVLEFIHLLLLHSGHDNDRNANIAMNLLRRPFSTFNRCCW